MLQHSCGRLHKDKDICFSSALGWRGWYLGEGFAGGRPSSRWREMQRYRRCEKEEHAVLQLVVLGL